MTNNEKIARWAGWKRNRFDYRTPDYENSDAAAITLLPVVAEKGYYIDLITILNHKKNKWRCTISKNNTIISITSNLTISATITQAVMTLIESEESNVATN